MESRELDIKKAYSQLLSFEIELCKQETLRLSLGNPYGKAPPFKFNLTSRNFNQNSNNYSEGLGRHPFLSPYSNTFDDNFSSTIRSPHSFFSSSSVPSLRKKKLPKIVKIVNNGIQESQALRNQIYERNVLREEMLQKFPSNIKNAIDKVFEHESNDEKFYQMPSENPEFNPFVRPSGKNYFFPLEMFYEEELNLNDLKYPLNGFSKYHVGDHYEWRPCKILRYNLETGKFFIKWEEKNEIKETSRHTVRFEFENEEVFLKKIEDAQNYRVNFEAGVRYLARLEIETHKQSERISISKAQESRIIRKIGQDINELIHDDIYDEIRKNYIKGVVEFSFKIEHFVSEAKKIEKPWGLELQKIENLQPIISGFRHSNFKGVCKKFNKLLAHELSERVTVREVVYKLSEISSFRLYNVILELSQKTQAYEDKKLKWIAKEWFTEIKIKVDKVVKKSKKLLKQQENIDNKYYIISQIIFESNLQVAIFKSKEQLKDHLNQYYAVLPFQNFESQTFSHLSKNFMNKRKNIRKKLKMDHEEPSKNLDSEDLKNFLDEFEAYLSKQIFSRFYTSYVFPTPLLKIEIVSRFSLLRQLRGKKFKIFTLSKQHDQGDINMFSKPLRRHQTLITQEGEILKALDYHVRSNRKNRKIPLLADTALDWYQINFDSNGLFITPVLTLIEESLRDILKAPLKSLEKIKSLSREKMLDNKLIIPNSSECYHELLYETQNIIKYSLLGPTAMIRVLSKYEYLVKDSPSKTLENIIVAHTNNYPNLHSTMIKIKKDAEEVEKLIPDIMNFGIFQLDLENIKKEIINNSKELLLQILEEIEKEKNNLLEEVHLDFENLINKLINTPQSVEEFVEIRDYLEKKGDLKDFKPISSSLETIDVILNIMEEFRFTKMKDSEEKYWKTKSWKNELEKGQVIALSMIERLYPYFQVKVKENINELNKNIDTISKEILEFSGYNNLLEADYYSSYAKDIAKRLDQFYTEAKVINSRENILKFEVSDFSKIIKLIDDFDKYNKLWEFIKVWNEKSFQWKTQPFRNINSKEVEETLRLGYSLLNMIQTKCQNDLILISIALVMQNKLNFFEKFLPAIFCLRDRAIQLRHWKEIWKILKEADVEGIENHKMEYQTLQHLLDKEILTKIQPISIIALRARHEFEIEKTVNQIESDLNSRIWIAKYQECEKIEIVKDINEVIDLNREHLLNLNFLLKNARYIDHCKGKINDLIAFATKNQNFLEDLAKFQEKWKEIYPLFLLPEISDDLRKEALDIKEIQTFYEKKLEFIMSGLVYSNLADGVFKSILEVNDILDRIREKVKVNLLEKQENCSRLCFMGYESLIIFLREIVKRGVLNISQLFPGIESIDISENYINTVKRNNSQLELVRPVTLFLANKALTLDTWVLDLENTLISTFKDKIKRINVDNDIWWDSEKDIQILATAEMIYFSSNIQSPTLKSKLEKTLENLIKNIRIGHFYLEKLSLIIISQLQLLEKIEKDPISLDFSLRYSTVPNLRVCVLNHSIDFCYEFHNPAENSYVPCSITEKLMLHIVNCVVSHQTLLLSGAHNSGKTSTLKELALYCGKGICLWTAVKESTFNVLMSIISGCASGGFWGVIEEIHNLNTSVFNTIMFNLADIIQKISANTTKILVNDKLLRVKPGFSISFTSSLPTKISKTLIQTLRIVEVIQPSFKDIIKIKLESLGLNTHFSGPIATVFELIKNNFESIELNKQSGTISYSLRTLNSLFRYFPDNLNEQAIVTAFNQLYASELTPISRKILTEILASVFPSVNFVPFASVLNNAFTENNFKSNKENLQALEMTLEMVQSQHKWTIITGTTCSGKSALLGISAKEYSKSIKKPFLVHKLNDSNTESLFKLISLCDKFTDSKFSYCSYPINQAQYPSGHDWIVIDSRFHFNWDTLNYITKGEIYINASRKIFVPKHLKLFIESENLADLTPGDLKNCNIIHLNDEFVSAADIFYTTLIKNNMSDLSDIFTPIYNTLVKAIFFSLTNTYFNYSLKIWTLQLLRLVGKMIKEARSLMSKKYDSLYSQIYKTPKSRKIKNPLGTTLISNALAISDVYIPQQVDKKGEIILNTLEFLNLSRNPPQINTQSLYEGIFVSAVIYTFGACTKEKQKFHRVFLDFLNRQPEGFAGNIKEKIKVKSVFDIFYVIESQEWLEWEEEVIRTRSRLLTRQLTLRKSTKALVEISKEVDSIFIPTKNSKCYIYWLTYYLHSGISSVVLGLHQSGKSLLASTVLKRQLSLGYLSCLPISLTGNTSSEDLKALVCGSLDQIKENYYTCVGGLKQFVYIDDLNLDSKNDIYELLRFWKENHGWYNQDFAFIGQIEVLAVHGYSANRSLYPRALRHFNVIYKEPYSAEDVSLIFRSTVDSDIVSVSQSRDDLFSVFDLTVDFYKKLFVKLHKINTERHGFNLSMTAFMMALRKISDLNSLDTLETEDYIKVFTYIFRTYLSQQVSKSEKEICEVMDTAYLGFLAEFQGDFKDEAKIDSLSILVDPSLFRAKVTDYEILTKEVLLQTIEFFNSDVEKARTHFFDDMKALHFVFNKPEETLGRYLLAYYRFLFDLKDTSNCTIALSTNKNSVLKAIALSAAQRLELQIFNFTQFRYEVSEFSSKNKAMLPIEIKIMLKEVMFKAIVLEKQVIVMAEIEEYEKNDFVFTILEIFNDIFTESGFKIPTCFRYYKEVISKLKIDNNKVNSEQVMGTILERLKKNVKILIVAESSNVIFSRIEKTTILEKLKHHFRSIFNYSKLIIYETINVPYQILEGIVIQDTVLNKWLNPNNKSIFTDFYKKYCEITGKKEISDSQLEKISYLANTIRVKNVNRYNKKIAKLKFCISRIEEIELEIESFGQKVNNIISEIERLNTKLHELEERKEIYIAKNQTIHNQSYVPPFVTEFEHEKKVFMSQLEKAKNEFEESKEIFIANIRDFSELSSVNAFQPGLIICVGYLQYLTTLKAKFPQNISVEAVEPLAKSLLNNLIFSPATFIKKLKKVSIEGVNLIEEVHTHPLISQYNVQKGMKAHRNTLKLLESMLKYKRIFEEYLLLKAEWSKTEEILPAQIKDAIENASNELMNKLSEINDNISQIQDKISSLEEIQENIKKNRRDAHDIIRYLNQKKIKWVDLILKYEKIKESFANNSLYIAFQTLACFEYADPLRAQLSETASLLIQSRDLSLQDSPLSASAYFSGIIEMQTLGHKPKGYHILGSSSFFIETITSINSVFTFDLPFPFVIDPYRIFQEYIMIEYEDDLIVVGLDPGFEQMLEKQMIEGKCALIINPSPAMFSSLKNLLDTRIKYCENQYRNYSSENLNIRIANQFIKFNPNFKLFVCSDVGFEENFLKKFTVFSLELEGNDWKNMMYSKIQQIIDPIEFNNKMDSLKTKVLTKNNQNQEDKSATRLLRVKVDYANPLAFFEYFQQILKNLNITELYMPKIQKSMAKEDPETRENGCAEAIEEVYRVHKVISFTNSLTKPYTINKGVFVDIVQDSVRELFSNTPDLTLAQLNSYADIIVYILISWIYASMPLNSALIFLVYFSMNKYIETSPEYTDEISQIVKDINNCDEENIEEVVKELREKYANLLPDGFSPSLLSPLEQSELYRDCRIGKSVSPIIKLYIYAKIRPDLIPISSFELLNDLMGYRYTYLPPPMFHKIAMHCEASRPIFVIYQDYSPIEFLIAEAREMAIHLEIIQPLLKSNTFSEKREALNINCKNIVKLLLQKAEFKKWIVIENANVINSAEIEGVFRAICYAIKDPLCKVFLLVHQGLESVPHLKVIFEMSYLMYFKSPETVKERIQHWHCWNNNEYYLKYRLHTLEKYHYHLTSTPTVTSRLFSKKNMKGKGVLKRITSALVFTNQVTNIISFGSNEPKSEIDILSHLPYNMSLFTAFTFLRSEYLGLKFWNTYYDTSHLLKEFLGFLKVIDDSLKINAVKMFVEVFWNEDFSEILEVILRNVNGINVPVGNKHIIYPLFGATKKDGFEAIDTLIDLTTSEDHLKVVGLDHSLLKQKNKEKGKKILKFIPSFLQMMKPLVMNLQIKKKLNVSDLKTAEISEALVLGYKKLLPDAFAMEIKTADPNVLLFCQHELKDFERLYLEITSKLSSMNLYLLYESSLLALPDQKIFFSILKDKVPKSWKKIQPYCLKNFKSLKEWLTKLGEILNMPLTGDLCVSYDPKRFFYFFVRSHNCSKISIVVRPQQYGIKGIGIKNGKIVNGKIVENGNSFCELPEMSVQIDNAPRFEGNYIYYEVNSLEEDDEDSSEYAENLVQIKLFDSKDLVFLFHSKLTQRLCRFKKIEIDTKPF